MNEMPGQRHLDRVVEMESGLRIPPLASRVPRNHRPAPSQKIMRPRGLAAIGRHCPFVSVSMA